MSNLLQSMIRDHVVSFLKALLLLSTGTLLPLSSGVVRTALAAEQFDSIFHSNSPSLDIWEIRFPNVKQESTPYEQITFRERDGIVTEAGGCVQTGGRGKTWKRCVDPGGRSSDHLYHGLVKVPSATMGFGRLAAVVNQALRIPLKVEVEEPLHLWLGYEDDSYSDNGYWVRAPTTVSTSSRMLLLRQNATANRFLIDLPPGISNHELREKLAPDLEGAMSQSTVHARAAIIRPRRSASR
jgi:hypothetical protein